MREYSLIDRICLSVDQGLRTLTGIAQTTAAPYPANGIPEAEFDTQTRKTAAALMRVNHTGEVCAQALYHGQGLVSKDPALQQKLQHAAIEEGDHLTWCQTRIDELGGHASFLNPLWYGGSFCLGMVAGMVGDKWSLGFLAETERQVLVHLEKQLAALPSEDQRSQAILKKMETDEAKHRDEAVSLGANELPEIVKKIMRAMSKVMVKTAYWI